MTITTLRKPFAVRLLGFTLGAAKGTLIFSLKILWLLFFVFVLIPVTWLAFEILARR
jgi:uncharacterized membrane protein required for colicin V production